MGKRSPVTRKATSPRLASQRQKIESKVGEFYNKQSELSCTVSISSCNSDDSKKSLKEKKSSQKAAEKDVDKQV